MNNMLPILIQSTLELDCNSESFLALNFECSLDE